MSGLKKPRLWLVMTLLAVARVLLLLFIHNHPRISSPAITHLYARQSLLEPMGRSEEGGEPQAFTAHALLQNNTAISVKEAMQHMEKQVSHGLVCQSPSTPHQQEFPFRYLINEPNFCRPGVNIINMIPVAPNNIASRLMIRELWGNEHFALLTKMRTMFVLGITNSSYNQRRLEAESQIYHDIIQLNFIDSYSNLTLKTLSILHWTQTFCQGAGWILKSDDDVFVNPFALNSFLKDHPLVSFVCKLNYGSKVCRAGRRCKQKWAVSYAEYANDYYPPYCNGPAYVISASMARLIYCAANKTHPHIIEDAYFTGILARAFQPEYGILPRRRFPEKTYHFLKRFWNGYAVFLQNLEMRKGASHALWTMILQHNNISTASLTRQQMKRTYNPIAVS